MKLGKKVRFIGAPNMAYMTGKIGAKRLIAKFDDKGFFETDDTKIAYLLEEKGLPYNEVNPDKEQLEATKELFD